MRLLHEPSGSAERRAEGARVNTPTTETTPNVHPGGVVTVAFLKARMDEGADRLGMFLPLVEDAVANITEGTFISRDVQAKLAERHGLEVPQHTIETLLTRMVNKKRLVRDKALGRYVRANVPAVTADLQSQKNDIARQQDRLAKAFIEYAGLNELRLDSPDHALGVIFRFLESSQIALLLGTPDLKVNVPDSSLRETEHAAMFCQQAMQSDRELRDILNGILQGLVLLPSGLLAAQRYLGPTLQQSDSRPRQHAGHAGARIRGRCVPHYVMRSNRALK
jgi:predicted transcriptional regulator